MNAFKIAYKILLLGILVVIFFEFVFLIIAVHSGIHAHGESSARWILGLLVLFVVFIEIRVRTKGGSTFDNLLKVHILFAVGLLFSLILLNFWFNGHKHVSHDWLVYLCFAFFIGTAGTGIPMILQRF